MAVPVGPSIPSTYIIAAVGPNHQAVRAPLYSVALPSFFTPVPVGVALKGGAVSTAYSETITTNGGTSPYTYAVTAGSLPTGTTLSSSGLISGTPTTLGTYTFTVTVTDTNGSTGPQGFSIVIASPASGGNSSYSA